MKIVGPGLTEFRIDRMAFGQPERTCLNIQNVPFCKTTRIRSIRNSVNQVSTMKISSMMSQIRQSMLSILTNKKLLIILPKACKLLPN